MARPKREVRVNKKRLLQILALLVIVVAIIASSSMLRAQSVGKGVPSTRWEYRLVSVRAYHVQREIDALADQGFEMLDFKVTQSDAGSEAYYHIVFKRHHP